MAKNFRADQLEVQQIILSGGINSTYGGERLGAMIYSGSNPPTSDREGGRTGPNLRGVGKDVMLFVSGNRDGKGKDFGSVTLFGGDVVVSGTMYMEQLVTEVSRSFYNEQHFSGSILVSNHATSAPQVNTFIPGAGSVQADVAIGLISGGDSLYDPPAGEGAIAFDYKSGSTRADALIYEANNVLHVSASRGIVFIAGSGSTANDGNADKTNSGIVDGTFSFVTHGHSPSAGQIRNRFIIFSGSNNLPGTAPEFGFDTNFYVSGNVGGRNSMNTSIGVFGGDLHVSGNLSVGGTGVGEWTDTGSPGDLHPADASGAQNVLIGGTTPANADIIFKKEGGAEFNFQGNSAATSDFIIWKTPAGALKQVLFAGHPVHPDLNRPTVMILSGGHVSHPDEGRYGDVSFFVSGACGSRNGVEGGTSIFGGDTVISGSLTVLESCGTGGSISGSIHNTAGGLQYLKAGSGITIASASNGQVTITSTAGGAAEWTDNGGTLHPADSSGAQTVVIGATSVGSGDIVLGSIGGADFNKQGQASDFKVYPQSGGSNPSTTAIHVDGSEKRVLILSGGFTGTPDESNATAIGFYVSGSQKKVSKDDRGQSLFGGAVTTSGSLTTRHARWSNIKESEYGSNIPAGTVYTVQDEDHYLVFKSSLGLNTSVKSGNGTLVHVALPPAGEFGEGRVLYIKQAFMGEHGGVGDGSGALIGVRIYWEVGDKLDWLPARGTGESVGADSGFYSLGPIWGSTVQLISNGVDTWYIYGKYL